MKKRLVFALATLMLLLSACQNNDSNVQEESTVSQVDDSSQETESEASEEEKPPLVPDFTLTSTGGESVSLSDFAGKTVVLNFWASWCPPCRNEMPDFQKLHDEISQGDDTVLLMLNQTFGRETKEDADALLEKNEYSFLTLYDEGEVGYSIFGIQSLPTTVVIDKDGYLSGYIMGQTSYDSVVKLIEEAS